MDRPAEPSDEHRAACLLGPQGEDLSHVRVRRPTLLVHGVDVVPAHGEPEVGDGREGRSPGADDDLCLAAQGGEEVAVARRRSEVGGQRDEAGCLRLLGSVLGRPPGHASLYEGLGEPVDVVGVREDDDGAPAAGRCRESRLRQRRRPPGRPALAGERGPDGARRVPCPQAPDEGVTAAVDGPGRHAAGCRSRRDRGGQVRLRASRSGLTFRPGRYPRLEGCRLLLDAGEPRRHSQPQDVAQRARVVVRDPAREVGDLRGEHRLRRDDLADRDQVARVRRARGALHDVAVDVLSAEAHLDPDPGLGVV